MILKRETIGDVLDVIENGINCKQNKEGIGEKITRIETIAFQKINYEKTGFSKLTNVQKHKYKLIRNDILFSHINSPIHVGKTAIYNGEEALYHGVNLLKLRVKKHIDAKYFNYFLNKLFTIGYWARNSKQAVNQASVNQTDIKCIPISYPPLVEQQRIAAKLDKAFAEIDKTIEAAKRIDENAQALFETARNDVFISKDVMWKQNKLGNICNFLNGFAFKSTDAVDISNVQLLRMGNMYRNKLDLNRKPVFYPSQFSVDFSKYVILPGDIIMSLTGTVGKRDYGYAVRIGKMEKILLLNQRIVKLYEIDESQVNKDYFLFYLRSKDFLNVLYSTANGTRQANLSSETIKGLSIPICSINEQKKIVAKLSFLKEKTKYISDIQAKKIYNLKSLKSSMLINMFTIEKTNAA